MKLTDDRLTLTPFADVTRVGGMMELGARTARVRARAIETMDSVGAAAFQSWPGASSGAWAGLRPMTPDGLPLVGRVEGFDNLYVAGGHGMLGVTLCLRTGTAIRAALAGDVDLGLGPFSPARFRGRVGRRRGRDAMGLVELGDLTWPEAQSLGRRGAIGAIAVGSVEQHGPHLPIAFDSIAALALVRATAARIQEPVVVPPLFMAGLSDHHLAFPGTISLLPETFGGVLTAYVEGLERLEIARIAIVSAHGGNFAFIGEFGRAYSAANAPTKVVGFDAFDAFVGAMFEGGATAGLHAPVTDVHAGLLETSVALHLIGQDRVRDFEHVAGYVADEPGWRERIYSNGLQALTETGVLGLPAGATAAAGEAITERLVALLAEWLATELGVTVA